MRLISRLLLSSILVCSSLAASASSYSSLVVFGDSLSDNGNNTLLGLANPGQVITGNDYVPSYTYGSGVYSNGPVWASQFASMLGLAPLLPSLAGGTDFAFGGATTGAGSPTPSLLAQTGMFLGSTVGPVASDALFVVAGGGNNARATLATLSASTPDTFDGIIFSAAAQYAIDVGNIVDSLQARGAQHIIVWNTPNLGVAPAVVASGPGAAYYGSVIANSFNTLLGLRMGGEVGVQMFDLFGLATQAANNGFTNVTDACGAPTNGAVCPDISQALFWDGIHPTTAAHHLIAERMFATAVPEPETWTLMLVGVGFIGLRARRRTGSALVAA
ncbi:MAG: hypothetical protein RIS34_1375 [Pseudomonadota bacterium]|jgi:outer membrane lipase/esterase